MLPDNEENLKETPYLAGDLHNFDQADLRLSNALIKTVFTETTALNG